MKKKKVAFVSNSSWSLYNFRAEIIRTIADKNVTIFCIAPRDKHSEKLIALGAQFKEISIQAYGVDVWSDLKTFFSLYNLYKQHEFDYIFHYTIKLNIYGSLAAKLCKQKSTSLITGRGRLRKYKNSLKLKIIESLYKLGCWASDEVWLLNDEDIEYFVSRKIVLKNKIRKIPGEGIDLNVFQPSEKGFKNNFLFAGRLLLSKGILHYLKAAEIVNSRHPNTDFNIVGFIDPNDPDSIDIDTLQYYASYSFIHFHGDTEDIKPYIEQASCVVLPTSYGEGLPRILLEGSAMKTPIISTNSAGCNELIVDGKNGFAMKDDSLESLIDQLMSFISLDIQARNVMGKNAYDHVKEYFDIELVKKQYEQTLINNDIINKPVKMENVKNLSIDYADN